MDTIRLRADGGVLNATFDAPPLNLIGPELVRDLVRLIGYLSKPTPYQVVVFDSADPDFFIPHVDMTKIPEYTAEAAKAGGPGDASLGMLYQRLSRLPVVTVGKLRGRARGAGSEFLLACDVRFAARENAVLGQPEVGFGAPPGAGAVERLARLLGSGRALEVLLGADDFTADVAERYGWINRAVPDDELDAFVARFARRVAGFPADAVAVTKTAVTRVNAPSDDEIRAAAVVFQHLVREGSVAPRAAWLLKEGLQTRGATEWELGEVMASITPDQP
ncbi:enoyl-CoA hydratase/isomerase family protein [Streptomyces sp. VRA16 Mangrove soil]|uniref:enoyl-CoA hydratase/isomerase family protein n=1 Tax=Streptomyces sp. VRA16 Mangrove soil TaxID=2817434 RepID=UPI001A9CFC66|nr:enoyl-CoA hydratase/isomerase family protein [Streptomyces sp. VRA16 Mangrove soil]MBO1334380.1 enoyl-CoA hydratase/isomerase family protein [Streptomyces sp. VRA16 Mangrove soil]